MPALAAAYDPRFEWRTLETPHFQLHFHEGGYLHALRCARAAERAHSLLAPILGHAPAGKTQLVVSDDVDQANGFATPLPYNTIRLFAAIPDAAPELAYHDWVFGLVSHEYAHILHFDTIGGLPRALNGIFGKLWIPNGSAPRWLIEGLAVLEEEAHGGRNHNALYDMYVRALALEGSGLPTVAELSNPMLDHPQGTAAYALGGRFLAFLAEHYGEGAIVEFIHGYGSRTLPYALNLEAKQRFRGKTFEELWTEFGNALRERYAAQLERVRARPVTEPRWITRRGNGVAHPRWLPGGTGLAYWDEGPDERAGLRRVGGGKDERISIVNGNGTFALAGGKALVAESDVFREYETYDDLFLVDLATGAKARLTWGERATDPELSADGATAVYVARTGAGRDALRLLRLGGEPETLLEGEAMLHLPRLSPDGKRVALEIQEGEHRDVALFELASRTLTRITDDAALDLAPSFTPDGNTVVFSSDRTGIFDVYAWSIESAALRQVTNVEGGAFEPQVSPDGKTLAFVGHTRAGFDLATTPFEPERFLEATAAGAEPVPDPGAEERDDGAIFPVSPYQAAVTVGPTWWLPVVGADGAGATFGVTTGGADVLGLHAWSADVRYSPWGRDVDYLAQYVAGWLYPNLALSSSRLLATGPSGYLESQWTPLAATLEVPQSHLDRFQAVSVGWRALSLHTLDRPSPSRDPAGPTAPRPDDGVSSELALGLAYGDALRYTRSISREEGRRLAVTVRFASPALGGDFHYATIRAVGTQYWRVPGTRHVVLALHGAGGAGLGDLGGRRLFQLGGLGELDPLGQLLGGAIAVAPDALRGYAPGALTGQAFALGNLELRFPLFAPLSGASTFPLFLSRLHGALFLDAGDAWGTPSRVGRLDPERLRFGAGAELRVEVVLGYQLRTDLRLGVARGLGPLLGRGAEPDPLAETQGYVAVGEAF